MKRKQDKQQEVVFLNPRTCGIYKSGGTRFKTDPETGLHYDSWIEINPEAARRLGIADGDLVWVESPVGKVKTKARLFAGTRPDCIHIPYGQGHKAYGRWAKDRGVNPNDLLVKECDFLGGFLSYYSTRVKVYKA